MYLLRTYQRTVAQLVAFILNFDQNFPNFMKSSHGTYLKTWGQFLVNLVPRSVLFPSPGQERPWEWVTSFEINHILTNFLFISSHCGSEKLFGLFKSWSYRCCRGQRENLTLLLEHLSYFSTFTEDYMKNSSTLYVVNVTKCPSSATSQVVYLFTALSGSAISTNAKVE